MGGHAFRIACVSYPDWADLSMEMGLYRCLPQLVKTGMGAYKSPADLEKDRPLVIGARVWLAVGVAYHDTTNDTTNTP